jgi:hypothetical protein
MLELSVKNAKEEILSFPDSPYYDVIITDGLTPANVNVSATELFGYDGAKLLGSQVGVRNIVLDIILKSDIEYARQNLYKYFPPNENIRLYLKSENRDMYIDGRVETFEANLYSMKQRPQISIICPQPFFISKENVELTYSEIEAMFTFPFEIPVNMGIEFTAGSGNYTAVFEGGDVVSGMVFEITATKTFENGRTLTFTNGSQTMRLTNIYMQIGDVLYINTFKGHKQIMIDRAITGNIDNGMKYFSGDWLQVTSGTNNLVVKNSAGASDINIKAQAFKYYTGV